MFKITYHSGFQIKLENGYTVSVQFGPGNYCSRRPSLDDKRPFHTIFREPRTSNTWESETAEVAIVDPNGDFVPVDKFCEDVSMDIEIAGWVTADQVATIITNVQKIGGEK